jgi:hypothetical protein
MGTGMGTRTGTETGMGTGMGTGKGMGQACVLMLGIYWQTKKKNFFFPRTTCLVVFFPYVGRLLQRRMTFPHMGKRQLG